MSLRYFFLHISNEQPEDLHVRQKAHLIIFPLAQDWLQNSVNYSHKHHSLYITPYVPWCMAVILVKPSERWLQQVPSAGCWFCVWSNNFV